MLNKKINMKKWFKLVSILIVSSFMLIGCAPSKLFSSEEMAYLAVEQLIFGRKTEDFQIAFVNHEDLTKNKQKQKKELQKAAKQILTSFGAEEISQKTEQQITKSLWENMQKATKYSVKAVELKGEKIIKCK